MAPIFFSILMNAPHPTYNIENLPTPLSLPCHSSNTFVCTFDLACNICRLNSLQSKRYLIGIMELPRHCYELDWTVKFFHNFTKSITSDSVKCFGKADKGHVKIHILFLTTLLVIPCCKDQVSS